MQIKLDDNEDLVDLLERSNEIKNITPIILNVDAPLVVAIDSPWGTGKTYFVKLWGAYLKDSDYQSIYFNAWETDYSEDPLVVLVSVLDKWIKENINSELKTKWINTVKKVLPNIAKRTAVAAVKTATLGTLDLEEQIEGVAADLTSGFASDLLDNFDKQSKAIEEFKKIVDKVVETLGENQKNLIIFIDELDRCRPTYAIEILERIKHLFSIKRLVFVLSTDMTQLSHSIQGVYGHQFDARKYLQRFIELDYTLKKPDVKPYIQSQLNKIHLANRERPYIQENLIGCLNFMVKRFALKLRDINLLLTRISLISCSIPINAYFDEPLLICLLIIRDRNKELYERYAESPAAAGQIIEFISQKLSSEEQQDRSLISIIGFLIAPNKLNDRYNDLIRPYEEAKDSNIEHERIFGCEITNLLNNFQHNECTGMHKRTIDRIELLNQISIGA
jgi:KAP family P-loop domain